MGKKILVICGPTASGKTDFAHNFASKVGAEIINADSMQVYKEIPCVTASPTTALKNQLPYHLYNFLSVNENFSAALYAEQAAKVVRAIHSRNKLPILVGGSGLYINSLIKGFSQIPVIADSVREKVRAIQSKLSAEDFFLELGTIDPEIVKILHANDTQRTARAMEVTITTGRSILEFQDQNVQHLPECKFEVLLLLPERRLLYEMCDKRLEAMFTNEAIIEEVRNLIEKFPTLESSAAKALAVPQIAAYLKGDLTKAEALKQAQAKTRQYAKRQTTWFKNQLKNYQLLYFESLQKYEELQLQIIKKEI